MKNFMLKSVLLVTSAFALVMPQNIPAQTAGQTATNTATNAIGSATVPASTNAPTAQSFLSTLANWASSFNPANSYGTNDTLETWTAMEYRGGVNIADATGFEARPIASLPGLQLRSVTGLAGIGGVVAFQEATIGYAIEHYDLQLSPYVGAGYDFASPSVDANGHAPYLALGCQIEKKLTANTFALMGIQADLLTKKSSQPVFFLGAGFTF